MTITGGLKLQDRWHDVRGSRSFVISASGSRIARVKENSAIRDVFTEAATAPAHPREDDRFEASLGSPGEAAAWIEYRIDTRVGRQLSGGERGSASHPQQAIVAHLAYELTFSARARRDRARSRSEPRKLKSPSRFLNRLGNIWNCLDRKALDLRNGVRQINKLGCSLIIYH
jgi:hypothetical protein